MSNIKKEFLKDKKVNIIKILFKPIKIKEENHYYIKKDKSTFIRKDIIGLGDDNNIYEWGKEWDPKEQKLKGQWILF